MVLMSPRLAECRRRFWRQTCQEWLPWTSCTYNGFAVMASFDSCLNKQFRGSHLSPEQSSTPPPSKNWSGSVSEAKKTAIESIKICYCLFLSFFVRWSFPTYLRLMPGGNQPPYIHAWVLGSATEMALQSQLKIRLFYDAKEMSTSALHQPWPWSRNLTWPLESHSQYVLETRTAAAF